MGCNGMPFSHQISCSKTEEDDHHQSPINPLSHHALHMTFMELRRFSGRGPCHSRELITVCGEDVMNGEEDLSDDGLYHGGRKRGDLISNNLDKLQFGSKTGELGQRLNNLRKTMAFLKRHFDAVKAENDSLIFPEPKTFILRDHHPESINLNKETIIDQGSCSTRSDNSSDNIQLEISRSTPTKDSHKHMFQISIPLFPTSSTHHHSAEAAQQLFFSPSSRPDHPTTPADDGNSSSHCKPTTTAHNFAFVNHEYDVIVSNRFGKRSGVATSNAASAKTASPITKLHVSSPTNKPITTASAAAKAATEETIYFDGGAHYGDLLANLLLGFTLFWLPLTLAAVSRAFFLRYRFTNLRVTVISGLTGEERSDFGYNVIKDVQVVPRLVGEWGDIIITLKDGTKVDLRSVPKFREIAKYCLAMADGSPSAAAVEVGPKGF
ncbi:unnamed protein product [Rhodiola kirilowii]